MSKTNLEKHLWLVRDGQIDYREFVDRTRSEFRAMAGYLLRRWQAPEWVTPEDVEQELYLGAWNHVWRFEPEYARRFGTTLEGYVTFNAISSAKRQLHKARGAKLSGSPDRARSQIERPLSRIREGEALAAAIMHEEPDQEREMIRREEREAGFRRALAACEGPRERVAILSIAEASDVDDFEGAGRALYGNLDARLALRLGSEDQATRYVRRNAVAVATRLITPG